MMPNYDVEGSPGTYEKARGLVLVALGTGCIVGAMVPVSNPSVAMGWLALLPVGIAATTLAIGSIGRMSALNVDRYLAHSLLRVASVMAVIGLVSCWLALSSYQQVALQWIGLAGGMLLLGCSIIAFGWYRGTR